MNNFNDLNFSQREIGGVGATHLFDKDIMISVQAGAFAYSTPREDMPSPDDFSSFEVALIDNISGQFITKNFVEDLNDDVLGWQTREDINELINKINNKGV